MELRPYHSIICTWYIDFYPILIIAWSLAKILIPEKPILVLLNEYVNPKSLANNLLIFKGCLIDIW
jgi:hypothetical protein